MSQMKLARETAGPTCVMQTTSKGITRHAGNISADDQMECGD